MVNKSDLTREAEVFHRQFFRQNAPKEFIEQYLDAHDELLDLTQASKNELRTVNIIIKRNLDALGIEPWLRSGSKRHLLSRKLLLTAYLAECDALHPGFRQETHGHALSLLYLCGHGGLAAFHLIKGRIQKAYYGLF